MWHQVTDPAVDPPPRGVLRGGFLWTEDDYLGPLHVETSTGARGDLEGDPPAWIDRLTVPEVLAKPLAQYAEPSKAFLDALGAGRAADARGVARTCEVAAGRAHRSSIGGLPIGRGRWRDRSCLADAAPRVALR